MLRRNRIENNLKRGAIDVRILNRVENKQLTKGVQRHFYKIEPATIGQYLHYGFMNPRIHSMFQDVKIVGTAFTVRTNTNDSAMVHKAVSLAEEGDVIIIERMGDGIHACVGEIVVYAAVSRKVAGIIVDGPCTDIQAIREIKLPVFASGLSPLTTKQYGISGEINTIVQCGDVTVHPGDLIVADDNGVLVLPQHVDYEKILQHAEKSEKNELTIKKQLNKGTPLNSIVLADPFHKNFYIRGG